MQHGGEGGEHGCQRLQEGKTLKEILEVATEFERAARDFYTDLATRVSADIQPLVEELADEEQQHLNLFSSLAQNPEIVRLNQARLETPPGDAEFSTGVELPDPGESPDDRAVLEYALARERTAAAQYRALAKSAAPGPIRDLFEFLADEERKHVAALERIQQSRLGGDD